VVIIERQFAERFAEEWIDAWISVVLLCLHVAGPPLSLGVGHQSWAETSERKVNDESRT
jgi:hypothetical protein